MVQQTFVHLVTVALCAVIPFVESQANLRGAIPPVPSTFAADLLKLVNVERKKVGAPPLCRNAKLEKAAQLHSDDMAKFDFLKHDGSNGTTFDARIRAQGYSGKTLAESIAIEMASTTAVMNAWMGSQAQSANILSTKYSHFGAGYARNPALSYGHYWTQDFGAAAKESCS
ncbi:TPA: hypothetical protein N0F65_008388 [Lagenidium giganteum]|uniref:SCP domain-containing protein n=1 Tax=Lagenidium giganteum TaxID=4803 RepID=A0AAV2Z103_9STRA|nr:TPA: hypothetical protein N0F65_008388 [Lagenidium giganteum]